MKTLLEIFDLTNEPNIIEENFMKRRLFHLHLKTGINKYYGSLQALFLDNKDLKVSKFTLDRYDFVKPFENEVCVINKAFILSAGNIRGLASK